MTKKEMERRIVELEEQVRTLSVRSKRPIKKGKWPVIPIPNTPGLWPQFIC